MNPTKCPHCGAESVDEGVSTRQFKCGTVVFDEVPFYGGGSERVRTCYERQIAALKDEIKRAAHELWCEGANGRDGFRSEWIADWNNSRAKQIAEG